jgi:ElaB/YqjD/DUF883 family membrane-anchored ribosome-binding protein
MGAIVSKPPTSSQPQSQPQSQTKEIFDSTKANQPKLPSLSAADIQGTGASPTNAALEQSLVNTTSDSEKLSVALKEIDRLRAQLAEAQGPQVTGLRKRGTGAGSDVAAGAETVVEKAKEMVGTTGSQGVPLEAVVGVAVVVFVLTYLFF